MARKTIRVEIPTARPDEFSKLLNTVVTYDDSLGAASILKADPDIDMAGFAKMLVNADSLREQSEAARAQSEALMQQAKVIYGTAKGQGVNTPDTLYYQLDLIKRTLLKKYKGIEEMMRDYGFNIVTGLAKSPVKKQPVPPKQNQ